MQKEINLSRESVSIRTQYNIVQWVLLTIWIIGLVIFISRPFLFLTNGIITNIKPDSFFIFVNFVYVIYSCFFVFINGIFLVNQYKTRLAKFIYIILGCMCSVLSLILIILSTIYTSNCNNIQYPTNPCNSEFFCCEFGSSVRECKISLFISPNCGVSSYSLMNLNPNSTFIEFFVWIGVFAIVQIFIIYIQTLYMDELYSPENFDEQEYNGDSNIGKKMGIYGRLMNVGKKQLLNNNNNKQDFVIMKIDNEFDLDNPNFLHNFLKNAMSQTLKIFKRTHDKF
jgi:hypothetical protein